MVSVGLSSLNVSFCSRSQDMNSKKKQREIDNLNKLKQTAINKADARGTLERNNVLCEDEWRPMVSEDTLDDACTIYDVNVPKNINTEEYIKKVNEQVRLNIIKQQGLQAYYDYLIKLSEENKAH